MRARVATVLLAAVTGSALVTGVAAAADATDLFVGTTGCSDGGPGTQSEPFCTVQHAADVVVPGQTVHIAGGNYGETVTLTRSGATGAPIAFVGQPDTTVSAAVAPGPALVIDGVQDVSFTSLRLSGGVTVTDSSGVTVDSSTVSGGTGPQIQLSGATSRVTISRDTLDGAPQGGGLAVGAGVRGTTVTTSVFEDGAAITATDAPDTTITGNTVTGVENACQTGISLSGATTTATVENNILAEAADCPVVYSVAADAAAAVTSDYDVVWAGGGANVYDWAGTTYPNQAAFTAATGQGGHDITADPKLSGQGLTEGSPAIDSADAAAPGELSTDRQGLRRWDDLLTPNTGTGSGIVDRGALELQEPYQVTSLTASPSQAPSPANVTFTAHVVNPWAVATQYTYAFGDGTPSVFTSATSVTHSFSGPPNQYLVSVTADTADGVHTSAALEFDVTAPQPLSATVQAFQTSVLNAHATVTAKDAFGVPSGGYSVDYGDGTPAAVGAGTDHTYAEPGTYTVTATVIDDAGNTVTTSQRLTVAGAYVPVRPTRVLDTRAGTGAPKAKLGPGGTLKLHLAGVGGLPVSGATAVVLNVTATGGSTGGVLTVYPDGTPKPTTSSLNFTRGQTIPNLVTVPLGADGSVDITNAAGTVDVVADLEGGYVASGFTGGNLLHTTAPTRVLDTRSGGGKIGPRGVREAELPVTAAAAVLNVTVTNPTSGGVLTVFPAGQPEPVASNLNFTQGQTTSNLVIVPVTGRDVEIGNEFGSVDVVADLEGYYDTPAVAPVASFTPAGPTRVLDTRSTGGALGANEVRLLTVDGVAGVPADATAVALNVTVTGPTAGGFLTVYPDDVARPTTSNLNFTRGETVANQVVVPVGPNGTVDLFNLAGSTNVVVDLAGYFRG